MEKVKSIFIITAAFLLFSCASTSGTNIREFNMRESLSVKTFVDTGVSFDGSVYTTLVFSEITLVEGFLPSGKKERIDRGSYDYDAESSRLFFVDGAERFSRYHIEGISPTPHRFVLYHIQDTNPLFLLDGKVLSNGTDFLFDSDSSSVTLSEKIDLNKDSYVLCWLVEDLVGLVSNKFERHEALYKKEIAGWFNATN